MDDFRILGIAETRDPHVVKEAFRARAKELHPDLASPSPDEDPLRKHFLFIAVTQAYRRVLALLQAGAGAGTEAGAGTGAGAGARAGGDARTEPERAPAPAPERPPGSESAMRDAGLALHKDPAYALYRTGMRYFMAIHPSAWDPKPSVPSESASISEKNDEAMKARVQELIRLFPRAYYYFGLVESEHPDSRWAPDARDKMAIIERRSRAYKKILGSFGAWRRAGAERGQEVAGIVDRTRRILEEEGDLRWPPPKRDGL